MCYLGIGALFKLCGLRTGIVLIAFLPLALGLLLY